jgi:hypothetical protein
MRKVQDALVNKDKIEVVCDEGLVAFLSRTTMMLIDFVNVMD